MTGLRVPAILVCLWLGAAAAAQPPKELVQYIQDARKAGVTDRQIEESAVKAGWEVSVVRDLIASLRGAAAPATRAKIPERPGEPKPLDRGVSDEYVIGEGDVLHISVWKEPDASVQNAVVRPDGKVSMPMLKDVQVSGLTPGQAEANITKQLTAFIAAPDVTVVISAINSKKVYLIGGVKKEGPIPYTYRMTVLQALSEAGGITDYAKRKKIYVLRHENGREYQLPFDYDAVLRGEKMELNVPLLAGDTVVVPK